jgi:hypothetical protein
MFQPGLRLIPASRAHVNRLLFRVSSCMAARNSFHVCLFSMVGTHEGSYELYIPIFFAQICFLFILTLVNTVLTHCTKMG